MVRQRLDNCTLVGSTMSKQSSCIVCVASLSVAIRLVLAFSASRHLNRSLHNRGCRPNYIRRSLPVHIRVRKRYHKIIEQLLPLLHRCLVLTF